MTVHLRPSCEDLRCYRTYSGLKTPMQLDECDYELPVDLIAQHPLKVRDRARLLILDRAQSTMTHVQVRDLVTILTRKDVLVINNSKVFPARLLGRRRDSGGRVEILLVRPETARCWQALVKPSQRLAVGAEVIFDEADWVAVIGAPYASGARQVEFRGKGNLRSWLAHAGRIPLHHISNAPMMTMPRPHCRPERSSALSDGLRQASGLGGCSNRGPPSHASSTPSAAGEGVEVHAITLHVGPGTFRPLRSPTVEAHTMDAERYWIRPAIAASLEAAKAAGKRLIAVGTTTTRALESAADSQGQLCHLEGNTTLFISPGYRFKIVDSLMTNFHLPRSTPLLLTMALAGRERIFAAYREAVAQQYRFYSYGDAMLIR